MTDQEQRDLMQAVTHKLLSRLREDMDWLKEHGVGVTIFAFTFDSGAIAYLSTSERADMLRTLREFLAYQDAGLMTEHGERGKS